MHIDYEVSERDYFDGQRVAIKNSSVPMVRWTRVVLPCFGALLVEFLIRATLTQGLSSMRMLPGLAFSLFFLSVPLLNRRKQKQLNAKSNAVHGRLTLDVDDSGMQFGGPITSAKVAWAYFGKFFEDEKAFVMYQKNEAIFHMVPKRALSVDQVTNFRNYLEQCVAP
jgi:hypothetical protein